MMFLKSHHFGGSTLVIIQMVRKIRQTPAASTTGSAICQKSKSLAEASEVSSLTFIP